MDTTEKYILMCEKAEEVQKNIRNLNVINWRLDSRFYTDMLDRIYYCKNYSRPSKKDIWLPRQDQLQEMVSDELVGLQTVCAVIHGFAITEGEGVGITIDGSMEQLWLAFVMHEKYQKRWNEKKEEWIFDIENGGH